MKHYDFTDVEDAVYKVSGGRNKMQPKYPDIHVQLSGEDGNALSVIGRASSAMRRARVPADEIVAFFKEATSGNYNHTLQTIMKWVNVS